MIHLITLPLIFFNFDLLFNVQVNLNDEPVPGIIAENQRYRETELGPVIDWKEGLKLEWIDFKSKTKIMEMADAAAVSSCGFGLESESLNGVMTNKIFVRFYCDQSWYDKSVANAEILNHEQIHFDICELYGRKLYRELLKLKKAGTLDHKSAEETYYELLDEYNSAQQKYDSQTKHGTNDNMQMEWNISVRNELLMLSPYADYHSF